MGNESSSGRQGHINKIDYEPIFIVNHKGKIYLYPEEIDKFPSINISVLNNGLQDRAKHFMLLENNIPVPMNPSKFNKLEKCQNHYNCDYKKLFHEAYKYYYNKYQTAYETYNQNLQNETSEFKIFDINGINSYTKTQLISTAVGDYNKRLVEWYISQPEQPKKFILINNGRLVPINQSDANDLINCLNTIQVYGDIHKCNYGKIFMDYYWHYDDQDRKKYKQS